MSTSRPKNPLAQLKRARNQRELMTNRPPDALTGRKHTLVEMLVPPKLAAALQNTENHYIRAYALGECSILVTKEFDSLHMSIAHPSRLPTWDEVAQARYRLLPGNRTYAMILPPVEEYINLHPHCFQLMEVAAPADGRGAYLPAGKAVPE